MWWRFDLDSDTFTRNPSSSGLEKHNVKCLKSKQPMNWGSSGEQFYVGSFLPSILSFEILHDDADDHHHMPRCRMERTRWGTAPDLASSTPVPPSSPWIIIYPTEILCLLIPTLLSSRDDVVLSTFSPLFAYVKRQRDWWAPARASWQLHLPVK